MAGGDGVLRREEAEHDPGLPGGREEAGPERPHSQLCRGQLQCHRWGIHKETVSQVGYT